MRIGLQLPSFSWPGGPAEIAPRLTKIAQTAEAAGFASLWVMDHFFQLPDWGSLDSPMLESYTTLGYLAAATKKIRLGAMVTGGIVEFDPGTKQNYRLRKKAAVYDNKTWQARDIAQHRLLFNAEIVVGPRQDLAVCATDW